MYKIRMYIERIYKVIDMPKDKNIKSVFEAQRRAEIYKKSNPDNMYFVVNEDNGDVEFQI